MTEENTVIKKEAGKKLTEKDKEQYIKELEKSNEGLHKQVDELQTELDKTRLNYDKLQDIAEKKLSLLLNQVANINKDLSDAHVNIKGNTRKGISLRRAMINQKQATEQQFAQNDLIV